MFGGSYTHSLDSAGRFVMPMNLRLQLGERFYVTKGVGCLCVFPEEWARKLGNELGNLASPLGLLLNPDIARLHRHFFSGMVETSSDKQSRVQLTPEHRSYAGIETEVVICGCGAYIELWSPNALNQYRNQNDRVEDLIASGDALLGRKGGVPSGEENAGVSQTGPAL